MPAPATDDAVTALNHLGRPVASTRNHRRTRPGFSLRTPLNAASSSAPILKQVLFEDGGIKDAAQAL